MFTLLCVGFFLLSHATAHAAEVTVAVASNFSAPMRKIVQNFELESGHKVRLSYGATGSFYAQIKNGGPFQILVAADRETPAKLEKEGLGVTGSSFTYAFGKLVLWSRQPHLVDQQGEILKRGQFQKLAIANPKLAPYGTAAMETLGNLALMNQIRPKLVQGEISAKSSNLLRLKTLKLVLWPCPKFLPKANWSKDLLGWCLPICTHPSSKMPSYL